MDTKPYIDAREQARIGLRLFADYAAMHLPEEYKKLIARGKANGSDTIYVFSRLCADYGLPREVLARMTADDIADIFGVAARLYSKETPLVLFQHETHRTILPSQEGLPETEGRRVRIYSRTKDFSYAFVRIEDEDSPHNQHVAILHDAAFGPPKRKRGLKLD